MVAGRVGVSRLVDTDASEPRLTPTWRRAPSSRCAAGQPSIPARPRGWLGSFGLWRIGRLKEAVMTALTDRVALVTGASTGIGASLAAMLAAEGARVVLAARRGHELDRVAEGIRRDGGAAIPIVTDLADDNSLARLLAETRSELGPIDVL